MNNISLVSHFPAEIPGNSKTENAPAAMIARVILARIITYLRTPEGFASRNQTDIQNIAEQLLKNVTGILSRHIQSDWQLDPSGGKIAKGGSNGRYLECSLNDTLYPTSSKNTGALTPAFQKFFAALNYSAKDAMGHIGHLYVYIYDGGDVLFDIECNKKKEWDRVCVKDAGSSSPPVPEIQGGGALRLG